MANSFAGNVAVIDDVSADLDIANLMFGLSEAGVKIKGVYFYDPTAADAVVLKDNAGNIVVELLCLTTNSDVQITFSDESLRCQGLKLVAADNTVTTGHILIYFA